MKDLQDFGTYSEAYDYAKIMDYECGYFILPFSGGHTVFER